MQRAAMLRSSVALHIWKQGSQSQSQGALLQKVASVAAGNAHDEGSLARSSVLDSAADTTRGALQMTEPHVEASDSCWSLHGRCRHCPAGSGAPIWSTRLGASVLTAKAFYEPTGAPSATCRWKTGCILHPVDCLADCLKLALPLR